MSSDGQQGKPRVDASAAAAAQPSGTTGAPGPASATGTGSETTGAPGPTAATGTGSETTGAPGPAPAISPAGGATGGSSPIPVTGTGSEATGASGLISVTGMTGMTSGAEGYGAASTAELPARPVALTALALVAAVLLAEGYLAAGPAGFVVAGTVLALVAILLTRAMMPQGEQRPPSAVRKDHRSGDGGEAGFPAYRKITSDLSWADASPRHYDHGLRPRLAGLLDARLAQRYGLDAAAQPERASELVGAELWPLLDMSRPPSNDSRGPGVSMATVDRIVTRLEEL